MAAARAPDDKPDFLESEDFPVEVEVPLEVTVEEITVEDEFPVAVADFVFALPDEVEEDSVVVAVVAAAASTSVSVMLATDFVPPLVWVMW
jgi:hypothetical protein